MQTKNPHPPIKEVAGRQTATPVATNRRTRDARRGRLPRVSPAPAARGTKTASPAAGGAQADPHLAFLDRPAEATRTTARCFPEPGKRAASTLSINSRPSAVTEPSMASSQGALAVTS